MFFQIAVDLQNIVQHIFEKNLHISQPIQLKSVLFEGQLCIYTISQVRYIRYYL